MHPADEGRWRVAEPHELAEVIGLQRLLYEHENLPFDSVKTEALLGELLQTPELGSVAVAVLDGRIAGYMVLAFAFSIEFGGRFVLLDELYVDERARGSGLGRAALAFAAGWARQAGASALRLEVAKGNRRALRLYLAAGFEEHDRSFLTLKL